MIDHNLSAWEAGSEVLLCNVPWTDDYRDIIRFEDNDALDSYLFSVAGPRIITTKVTYCKPGVPIKLQIPFNRGYIYNYLRVRNNAPNDDPRNFYYFIQNVEYAAPDTTIFYIQLDVWQTFFNDVEFGRCYVERGHIGVANADRNQNNGRDFLTTPEGLDCGGEYDVYDYYSLSESNYADWSEGSVVRNDQAYSIIITSSVLFSSGGTIDNPSVVQAPGDSYEGLPNGMRMYVVDSLDSFRGLMTFLSQRPWITQGISSIQVVPTVKGGTFGTETVSGYGSVRYLASGAPYTRYRGPIKDTGGGNMITTKGWKNRLKNTLPDRYKHLDKFLVYPYTLVEATMWTGTPLVMKPECMYDDSINFIGLTHYSTPSARIVYFPYAYNHRPGTGIDPSDGMWYGGSSLDFSTMMNSFPTMPVTVNAAMAYMAANRNSIAYQQQSADWAQSRAMAGADLAYNQASASIGLSHETTAINVAAATTQAGIANRAGTQHAAVGAASSVAGGLMGANPMSMAGGMMSAATGVVNNAIDIDQRNRSTAASNAQAQQLTGAQTANMGYNRDTNLQYAQYAAAGDYQNAIAGINAKVQDAAMIPPTTAGQVGGDGLAFAMSRNFVLTVLIKSLQGNALRMIGEYWLRYGYAVNRFTTPPPSLQTMTKFTYWKLKETYLSSSTCPEMYRQTIRGIFEKGVTVWSNPDDMGIIDISDNQPLDGIKI